jgi:protein-S-isoprenylcysteine O-methyltransferase Ste14
MSNPEEVCIIPKKEKKGMVHVVLSHSYFMYLLAIILGLILDKVFGTSFNSNSFAIAGFIAMILGSLLIYWAQHTTNCTKKELLSGARKERDFERGPYKYSRNPTHIGLSLLTLGFGLLAGSLFVVILMIFTFMLTKLVFLHQEEDILEQKYGQAYCEYKAKVRTWL